MLMGEEPPRARWIYGEYEDEEEEELMGKGSHTNHRSVAGGGNGAGQLLAATDAIQGAGGSSRGQACMSNNGYTVVVDC